MGISWEDHGKVFMGSFLVRFSWKDHGKVFMGTRIELELGFNGGSFFFMGFHHFYGDF